MKFPLFLLKLMVTNLSMTERYPSSLESKTQKVVPRKLELLKQ